jgi:tRNA-dihydrouridine synthase B
MALKKNFQIGSLTLPNNIFYAPLAGCSDLPFRKMTAFYRPGLIFCEMVMCEALVRNIESTNTILDYEDWMHPIGAQICGPNAKSAKVSAKIIEDRGFDVLDLNCGCPVDRITKDGSGSGLLKTPEKIGEILTEMVDAVSIPVTVKIRVGWDNDSINATEITKIAEKAGAKVITVHGRTRKQGYQGNANWELIRECKEVADTIKVIGNGDVVDFSSAKGMFDATNCDGVLVARGTMGKPWVIKEIVAGFEGTEPHLLSLEDVKKQLLLHYGYILDYRSKKRAILDMKRVGCYYLKDFTGVKAIRRDLNKIKSPQDAVKIIEAIS